MPVAFLWRKQKGLFLCLLLPSLAAFLVKEKGTLPLHDRCFLEGILAKQILPFQTCHIGASSEQTP